MNVKTSHLYICFSVILLTVNTPIFSACKPTPGLFITNATFNSNSTYNAGIYNLTKTPAKIDVKKNGLIIYTHTTLTGYISTFFFYGTNNSYLLIKDTKTTSITIDFKLLLINLTNSQNVTEFQLLNRQLLNSEIPQLNVQPSSGNGHAIFYYIGRNPSTVENLEICCSDDGTILCSTPAFSPTGQVIAEATDSSVIIKEGGDTLNECLLPFAAIQLSTNNVDFGDVVEGKTFTKQFTIQNTGTASLSFNNSATVSTFSVTPASGVIAESGSNTINATFSPPFGSTIGTQTGILNIIHNGPNQTSPSQISLSGNVIAAIPAIQLSTDNVDFGDVVRGKTITKQFTILNTGTASMSFSVSSTISIFAVSPNSGVITESSDKTISVTFSPSIESAIGIQTGILNIIHNGPNQTSPTPVYLSGNVVKPKPPSPTGIRIKH